MEYFYWDSSKLSEHRFIREDFCEYCRYRPKKDAKDCPRFIYSNGVCIAFVWRTSELFEEYKRSTLESKASTIYLKRGYKSEDIAALPRKKLLSVLTNEDFDYFEKRIEEDRLQTEEVLRQRALGFTSSKEYRDSLLKGKKSSIEEPKPQGEALTKVSSPQKPLVVPKPKQESSAPKQKPITKKEQTLKPKQGHKLEQPQPQTVETPPQPLKSAVKGGLLANINLVTEKLKTQKSVHYIYVGMPDGTEKVIKRGILAKTYKGEVARTYKWIKDNNLVLLKEVLK
jgi:hypothetical protein